MELYAYCQCNDIKESAKNLRTKRIFMSGNMHARRINGELLMTPDPIVEEVRTIREQLAAQFHFDIRRIIEDTQRRQALSKNKIVSFERPKITLHQADENKTSP